MLWLRGPRVADDGQRLTSVGRIGRRSAAGSPAGACADGETQHGNVAGEDQVNEGDHLAAKRRGGAPQRTPLGASDRKRGTQDR